MAIFLSLKYVFEPVCKKFDLKILFWRFSEDLVKLSEKEKRKKGLNVSLKYSPGADPRKSAL